MTEWQAGTFYSSRHPRVIECLLCALLGATSARIHGADVDDRRQVSVLPDEMISAHGISIRLGDKAMDIRAVLGIGRDGIVPMFLVNTYTIEEDQ